MGAEVAAPAIGALLQLARRARQAESSAVLGFVVVNESRQLLDFRQSAVYLPAHGVAAVSGLPEVERDAPYVQWLAQLCHNLTLDAPHLLLDAHALPDTLPPALATDWDDWLPAHLLVLALRDTAGRSFGQWLLARDSAWSEAEISVARELADIYAHAWQLFQPRASWRERLLKLLGDRRRKRNIAIAVAVVLCFPVRLTVLAPAEITPRDALPIRAPLEGAVDAVHVRPNQAVAENQPLFDLDTTGLRTRLSVARKAYEGAAEEFRQAAQLAVSDDEKGRLEMSQRRGRMEEKAAELRYSEQLLDRVQVKSSRAGVAVFTDAADWIGKAVTIGERVMLIADPGQVEISLRLPAADAIEIDPAAAVTLYLTTAPQFSYKATLTYAAYKAEVTPEGIVAYKLKAKFNPGETLPRLGLTGTAKIHGGWVPLVYYVLRRPLATLRQWVGW